ncbi:hypothetical protein EHS25_000941 [Saitozyma podzolica]|uniref:Uncharacterized protein n=1 Tax=Saitozyma podzolica TaxID=1890683 RepID=A0A427YXN4_9TREE|nr:hypothetical protein EHS25_000941 [Saitozyma podzolica]
MPRVPDRRTPNLNAARNTEVRDPCQVYACQVYTLRTCILRVASKPTLVIPEATELHGLRPADLGTAAGSSTRDTLTSHLSLRIETLRALRPDLESYTVCPEADDQIDVDGAVTSGRNHCQKGASEMTRVCQSDVAFLPLSLRESSRYRSRSLSFSPSSRVTRTFEPFCGLSVSLWGRFTPADSSPLFHKLFHLHLRASLRPSPRHRLPLPVRSAQPSWHPAGGEPKTLTTLTLRVATA